MQSLGQVVGRRATVICRSVCHVAHLFLRYISWCMGFPMKTHQCLIEGRKWIYLLWQGWPRRCSGAIHGPPRLVNDIAIFFGFFFGYFDIQICCPSLMFVASYWPQMEKVGHPRSIFCVCISLLSVCLCFQASSSTLGNQNAMFLQAEAIIMYLGLNWTHRTGSVWSPFRTQTWNSATKITTVW